MAIDAILAIDLLVPAAQYDRNPPSYQAGYESETYWTWTDARPKPTWQELVDAFNAWQANEQRLEVLRARADALFNLTNLGDGNDPQSSRVFVTILLEIIGGQIVALTNAQQRTAAFNQLVQAWQQIKADNPLP